MARDEEEERMLMEERRRRDEEFGQPQLLTQTFDPELEQMRGVLERMARRDDIPEEWWMSVGLVPSLPGRVVERMARERERARMEGGLERRDSVAVGRAKPKQFTFLGADDDDDDEDED